MFRCLLILTLLSFGLVGGVANRCDASAAGMTSVPKPFFFTENKGQWDSRVLYKCSAKNGMTWFLERDGITLLVSKEDHTKAALVDPFECDLPEMLRRHPARYPMKAHSLKFRFLKLEVGQSCPTNEIATSLPMHNVASSVPRKDIMTTEAKSIEAQGELPWHNNYFLGNDSTKWAPNCRNYSSVVYREVWEGIDIEWYENEGKLEFDFVVHPGFNPNQIRMSCEGLDGELSLAGDGFWVMGSSKKIQSVYPAPNTQHPIPMTELRLQTSLGELRTALPSVYQVSPNGSRSEVDAKFEIFDEPNHSTPTRKIFGITLPNGYNTDHSLRIDPLIYSTFLGGTDDDYGMGIVGDGNGGVIVTGGTGSTDFPVTAGAGQTFLSGSDDCFVTYLNSTGTQLLYSTYLGGSGFDNGYGITSDESGGVIVTGGTHSGNFPRTAGSYHGGTDCFVSRLNSTGSQLIFSVLLGGLGDEYGYGIIEGDFSSVFVTGSTTSNSFPTTIGVYDTSFNGGGSYGDCFVSNLNGAGTILCSTYLGGSAPDVGFGITRDGNDGIIVTGVSSSSNFPTTIGAFDTSFNGGTFDCFVAHLNGACSQLLYSTYLGGSGNNWGTKIIVDSIGNAIITGATSSLNFPITTSAYDSSFNGGQWDCFVTQINSAGSQLTYSSYLGGLNNDYGNSIVNDGNGGFIITGRTNSIDFPTSSTAFDTSYNGDYDCFVTRLKNERDQLLYSSYFGGAYDDRGFGIISDGGDGVVITGWTNSSNFPTTPNAFDTSYNGGSTYGDCFVAHLSDVINDDVPEVGNANPQAYILKQNYPNPFNSSTKIAFSLPNASETEIHIYNNLGQNVKSLHWNQLPTGQNQIEFSAEGLATGVYWYQLQSGQTTLTKQMTILK